MRNRVNCVKYCGTDGVMFKNNNNKDNLVKISFSFFHLYTFLILYEMIKLVKYCGRDGVYRKQKS